MAEHSDKIAAIAARVNRASFQKTSGPMHGLGNALRKKGVFEYVEAFVKRTGEFPRGQHSVSYQSGWHSDPKTPKTSRKMDVSFPFERDEKTDP